MFCSVYKKIYRIKSMIYSTVQIGLFTSIILLLLFFSEELLNRKKMVVLNPLYFTALVPYNTFPVIKLKFDHKGMRFDAITIANLTNNVFYITPYKNK
jgi:hypothetical protein